MDAGGLRFDERSPAPSSSIDLGTATACSLEYLYLL